ncbi:MAG: hypothetical protein IPH87_28005 [Anaerolineae bacterium]|nr:hypothetical protein [Anaerolineae bacterium]
MNASQALHAAGQIPATKAGPPAISAAIAAGSNVNVTLIFSRRRYARLETPPMRSGNWCERGRGLRRVPAVVGQVEQRDEFAAGFLIAHGRGVIVVAAVGIRGGVTPLVGDVLQRTVTPAMVIAGGAAQVVGAPTTAVAGQHIVEIEDKYIGVGVVVQPLLNQPAIERAGVGAPCAVLQRRRGDDDEELVLACGEIGQDVVVDALGVGDGHGLRT